MPLCKLRVFLCHASQDKPIVRELYQRLLSEGWIDPWLDEEKLLPGQDWDMEIEKAVEDADAVIVFLSNNSVGKEGYVQRELKFVLDIALEKTENTIFIIPIRLNDCDVPRRIKSWHYEDFFPSDRLDYAFRRLLKSLMKRLSEINNQHEITEPSIQVRLGQPEVPLVETGRPKNDNLSLKKIKDDHQFDFSRALSTNAAVIVFIALSLLFLVFGTQKYIDFVKSGERNLNASAILGMILCFSSPLITFLGVLVGITRFFTNKNVYTRVGMFMIILFLMGVCITLYFIVGYINNLSPFGFG